MEVTLRQLEECPTNTELVVFCRIVDAEGSQVTLEDLSSGESHSFEVEDTDIPEDMFLPVEVALKKHAKVTGIRLVENKQMLAILTDPAKLRLFEHQSSRAIKILHRKSRTSP